MANRRAERLEIAGVEGVSCRADYRIYDSVAIFRHAVARRIDRND